MGKGIDNLTKEELTVWVDLGDVDKVQRIDGFIDACDYHALEPTNPYEWGKIEQANLTIRFRATSFIREIKRIFIG